MATASGCHCHWFGSEIIAVLQHGPGHPRVLGSDGNGGTPVAPAFHQVPDPTAEPVLLIAQVGHYGMATPLTTEQIAAVQATSLDIWIGLTSKTLEGVEKLINLNLQTMKSALVGAQENARKVCAAKDAAELLGLQPSLWQLALEQAQAYRQQLADIASATRADFAKVAGAQYEANKRQVQDAIDNAAKGAPAGSEAAVAAWQSALAASTTLCESMQQAAKQAAELAESNWSTAAAAASNAAKQATAQAARATKR